MTGLDIQAVAGIAATALFVTSTLPMLIKAGRTRDLRSYSLANIALANVGNLLQWLYVSSLPFGPIWFLHGFHTGTTALMLAWYLRYAAPCVTLPCLATTMRARFQRWSATLPSRGQLRDGLAQAVRSGRTLVDEGASRGVTVGACC